MNRIFIDLDGVLVDFDRHCRDNQITPDECKALLGAYQTMAPMEHAIEAVATLVSMGFEVWLATKPPTGVAHAYADKAQWVFDNLPDMRRRLILTHDKGLLGDAGDYLIDDRPHRANCEKFPGHLIHFGNYGNDWPGVIAFFKIMAKTLRANGTLK